MSRGKHICKELKAVRKRIAEENGIPLEIPECTYHGSCKGTCPRCESEVQFLENELAKRVKLGKVARVAGLVLALGSSASATAQTTDTVGIQSIVSVDAKQKQLRVSLSGVVEDSRSHEPLPFVNVEVLSDDGKVIQGVATDFDGKYDICLPEGVYMIRTSYVGYHQFVRTDVRVRPTGITIVNIALTASDEPMEEIIVGMIMEKVPHIEMGPEGNLNTDIQGVLLRVQY